MKRFALLVLLTISLVVPAAAQALGDLTLKIVDQNGNVESVSYSAEALLELDRTVVQTKNDYIDATKTFEGPSLRKLLESVDLKPSHAITLTALNDYRVTIPAEDVLNYDVIIAVLMDGERMSVREKGPFWVIYPMDQHPELQEPKFNDRLIWQLSSVELVLSE